MDKFTGDVVAERCCCWYSTRFYNLIKSRAKHNRRLVRLLKEPYTEQVFLPPSRLRFTPCIFLFAVRLRRFLLSPARVDDDKSLVHKQMWYTAV